jgi:hypothetical protein
MRTVSVKVTAGAYIGEEDIVSAQECRNFLVSVANDLPSVTTKYREWLPNLVLSGDDKRLALAYALASGYLWSNERLPLGSLPKDLTSAYTKIFRYKLRVIWHRAIGSIEENPHSAAMRLIMETRDFQSSRRKNRNDRDADPDIITWYRKSWQALDWLHRNTDKLRRCGIAECRIHPYFIVSPAHKIYCSDTCKELAEVARVDERVKEQAAARKAKVGKSRIGPEGSENISKVQKARWAENRKDAKKKTLLEPSV